MPFSLENIGMTSSELEFEINRGGRFVIFQYCISVLVITFKRPTSVKFIKAGESAAAKSLPYTVLSLLLGWWGIPWGFIYTPQVIYKNLKGGTDVTQAILARVQG
jgi:hypothetical protein